MVRGSDNTWGSSDMKKSLLKCGAAALVVLVVGVGGAVGFIYSGIYDFRATEPHWPIVAWALHKTYDSGLDSRAEDIPIPGNLETAANVQAGAKFYAAHCIFCHGEPGKPLNPIGKGINPPAPFLLKPTRHNRPNEMYYVAKYGVKMTAMPAFGKSFPDDVLWQVAAFLHAKRGISPADYAALTTAPAQTGK